MERASVIVAWTWPWTRPSIKFTRKDGLLLDEHNFWSLAGFYRLDRKLDCEVRIVE